MTGVGLEHALVSCHHRRAHHAEVRWMTHTLLLEARAFDVALEVGLVRCSWSNPHLEFLAHLEVVAHNVLLLAATQGLESLVLLAEASFIERREHLTVVRGWLASGYDRRNTVCALLSTISTLICRLDLTTVAHSPVSHQTCLALHVRLGAHLLAAAALDLEAWLCAAIWVCRVKVTIGRLMCRHFCIYQHRAINLLCRDRKCHLIIDFIALEGHDLFLIGVFAGLFVADVVSDLHLLLN